MQPDSRAIEYRKAAEQGDAEAQCKLGNCYYYGNGVDEDETEAIKWYRKAAEQGNEEAQNNLGNCYVRCGEYYYNGDDYAEADKWYRQAAEQRIVGSDCDVDMGRIGDRYYNGDGVDRDYAEAVKWYQMAYDDTFSPCSWKLARCYRKGYGVKKSYAKAIRLYFVTLFSSFCLFLITLIGILIGFLIVGIIPVGILWRIWCEIAAS